MKRHHRPIKPRYTVARVDLTEFGQKGVLWNVVGPDGQATDAFATRREAKFAAAVSELAEDATKHGLVIVTSDNCDAAHALAAEGRFEVCSLPEFLHHRFLRPINPHPKVGACASC